MGDLTFATHSGPGAFEINSLAAVCALIFAGLWIMGWSKTRISYMMILSVGWFGLCMYWSMLAITAGSNPVWDRVQLAPYIRFALAVSVSIQLVGKMAMMRTAWITSHKRLAAGDTGELTGV